MRIRHEEGIYNGRPGQEQERIAEGRMVKDEGGRRQPCNLSEWKGKRRGRNFQDYGVGGLWPEAYI